MQESVHGRLLKLIGIAICFELLLLAIDRLLPLGSFRSRGLLVAYIVVGSLLVLSLSMLLRSAVATHDGKRIMLAVLALITGLGTTVGWLLGARGSPLPAMWRGIMMLVLLASIVALALITVFQRRYKS